MTKQTMKQKVQFAYAAGILDGEGCFSIVKQGNSYLPRIQVVMTNQKPLNKLVGLFGGSLVQTKMAENGNKIPYHYTASGKNANRLILSALPYLLEKKEQAEMLLVLQRDVDKWNAMSRKRGDLPLEVIAFRASLKEKLHALKSATNQTAVQRSLGKRESLSYLAGMLEAEGAFCIHRGDKNHFYPTVSVGVTYRPVLEELERWFGGTIIAVKRITRPMYLWRAKGRSAADLCRRIFPYLCFKHEEADLLRQLQNTTELYAKKFGPSGLPQNIVQKRVLWFERLKEIHGRARAQTKSEQPQLVVSDSRICTEPLGAGLATATVA